MLHIEKLLRRIRPARQNLFQTDSGQKTRTRINNYGTHSEPRALLSYLVQPVIDELEGGETKKFSNDGIARAWPRVLERLGYCVDIINWDDDAYRNDQRYKLVVVHGAINYSQLRKAFPESTYIYFSTGSYWKFHNAQEDARLAYFKQRHKTTLPRDRYITLSEELCNREAAGIIALGNKEVINTYAGTGFNVINLPIGCYPDNRYDAVDHDFEQGRRNFLFFSGSGNVHKGLDLLLDVFRVKLDYTLHICTFIDKELGIFYEDVLKQPNIVVHDFVELRSEKFYEIIDKCNYVIFPSCSEGSPGSVVECMLQGLIPIVSKSAHIDVGSSGLVINECTINNLEDAVKEISAIPSSRLKKLSREARNIATTTHSSKNFEDALSKAVVEIMGRDNK